MLIKTQIKYLIRTQKLAIIIAVSIFIGILAPVLARYQNELIAWAFATEGIEIDWGFLSPSIEDGWIQVHSQVLEIYMFIHIFILGSLLNLENHYRFSETYWATPINRFKHGGTKIMVGMSLITLGLMIVGAVSSIYLNLFFDGFNWMDLGYILFPLWLIMVMIYSGMVLIYSIYHRFSLSIISGIALYFVLTLFSGFRGMFFAYFPSRLTQIGVNYVISGETPNETRFVVLISLLIIVIFWGISFKWWKKHR